MTKENEMVAWHHKLNGREFEQALGLGDGQGSLECCSPWGCKELDMTEQLNNNNNIPVLKPTNHSWCWPPCGLCFGQQIRNGPPEARWIGRLKA